VAWGANDSYISPSFAAAYAEALGGARIEVAEDAGHWPWLDRPELVATITDFLAR
jgi:pimeloyl-ACP methyl ester carboxylesterase